MVDSLFGIELKNKLLKGIQKLNNSVASTLGPGGRTVLIEDPMNGIKVTKDGVTVAKAFSQIEDEVENIGAQLVKQVSIKSASEAGDGTTTSTLLTTTIIEEGLKAINQGVNPVAVKKGIDSAAKEVISILKQYSKDIDTEDQIKQVATISGNNDEMIGNLIAAALEKVGRDGVVAIEESKTGETSLETVEGMQFDRGYKSPYFVTNNNTMQAVLEDPYIFMYDGRITTAAELLPVLTKVNAENKSLLVVAEDIDGEALATLIVNKGRGIVKAVAVKAPEFGERRTLALEDLAVITGGQVLSKDKGHRLDKLTVANIGQYLGKARTVTVEKEKTTIVDGGGDKEAIQQRALDIKDQIEKSASFYDKEKLQERLGKLVGGVAVISVGGNSELEMREKKDRVEDALFATRAALDEGVVPGGGMALYKAVNEATVNMSFGEEYSEDIGKKILLRACKAPFVKILSNAGIDNWHEVATEVNQSNLEFSTYDAKAKQVVDAFNSGLLDPTKVVRVALENASSVAGTILTTESVIYSKREDTKEGPDMMGMGF
jgi:chaperonin GroEL